MDESFIEIKVESPCIRNCCLDEQDICLGCFRKIDEIVGWQNKPEQEKRDIIKLCQLRARKR